MHGRPARIPTRRDGAPFRPNGLGSWVASKTASPSVQAVAATLAPARADVVRGLSSCMPGTLQHPTGGRGSGQSPARAASAIVGRLACAACLCAAPRRAGRTQGPRFCTKTCASAPRTCRERAARPALSHRPRHDGRACRGRPAYAGAHHRPTRLPVRRSTAGVCGSALAPYLTAHIDHRLNPTTAERIARRPARSSP